MDFPNDLKYSRSHEWVRVEGSEAVVGLTDYAQEELGDIVYIELPEEGGEVEKETAFGVVESVKATEDLFSPVSGKVVEVNSPLDDSPEMVNEDPYGDGWLIRLEMTDQDEIKELMNAEQYHAYVEAESD
ncbi:MAG: glycine cleavage system protein H [Deltaproteobacteria bacterium RBG_13_61_14]|nr:MAG: glycine cleavage system protein H [Deltaproteobacteria bacterium RBG_13_61_14]